MTATFTAEKRRTQRRADGQRAIKYVMNTGKATLSGGLNISDFFVGRISFGFWAKF